ncbi:MAG: alpha-glucan family phosphorylase [Bacteroidales bacterium]|nr:alpha-glucan family phosphorylase [Bacteroidales bacterium]
MSNNPIKPDYLFEVSWEVCNRIGGIYTVITTKSKSAVDEFQDYYIAIGPDLVHETGENPEFIQDTHLYREWQTKAEQEGLRIKVGRWKINTKPVVILVDFSDAIGKKDEIFSKLWEEYKLDSISGQWDYIEPTLFGYTVGRVIESFVLFNLTSKEKIAAHFHEWMTGTGILYLKKNLPQIATIFTTHATILGRALAGNNRYIYQNLKSYNPDEIAKEYRVISKQSLEKTTAYEADIFTTVSEITAEECKYFLSRKPDLITPNGFEESAIPKDPELKEKRNIARQQMLNVASKLVSENLPDNTFILATSGRYEFKNKGVDLFIEAVNELRNKKLERPVIAFLLNPAHHYSARKDLLEALEKNEGVKEGSRFLTHYLHDSDLDPIMKRIKQLGFTNEKKDNVKIIYIPSYLSGNDGIFNLSYYDLLMGCDQTVFVTNYEPWGYTPLESLALSVPTITTSLSGIGRWIKTQCKQPCKSATIIDLNGKEDKTVISKIVESILSVYSSGPEEIVEICKKASEVSKSALWSSVYSYYKQAHSDALDKISDRSDLFVEIEEKPVERVHDHIVTLTNKPLWKRIIVRSKLPQALEKLHEISDNIWWTWDDEAQELFEEIDNKVWRASDFNPSILFEQVPYKRLDELSKNTGYIARLEDVHSRFMIYMEGKKELNEPKIAYFSMEYGFHDSLKLYSGGLGILAGDYLKEASDAKLNIVAVGILYRYGYFSQMISTNGEQQANYDYQHFSKIPVHPVRDENGEFKTVQIMLPGRIMYGRIWKLNIGRIEMYLLDTDFEKNSQEDRFVSHQLYGGDKENRLKQELMLGVGGIRALQELGIEPDLFHSNEGHSAFIGLERIKNYMKDEKLTFAEAHEIVRSSTLFTTHTPVPAGHDHFDEDLLRKYLGHYPGRLNMKWENFMALGRSDPNDWQEKFNMSYLAAHMAQEVNGVSMLHGTVTRDMFAKLWPGYLAEELHISYVTNGVHWSTWTAKEWKKIYHMLFDGNFVDNQSKHENWQRIYDIDDKKIWDIKQKLRSRLINAVKERFQENWIKRHEDPKQIVAINNTLSDKALTIVFARRFATYKRAHLLFRNPDRLAKIVNDSDRPVQFIFAGKAHPADKAGQALIKMIVDISKKPAFLGRIIFLQNYSIGLAKLLVSGADIWLNTPTRPLEASGTSGEKAIMNGTLHFSVLDGWWVEGYQPEAGWALTNERTYENQEFQDDLDSEIIYSLFENEIIPAFYNRSNGGYSQDWVKYIKNTIANVSPKFTTRRMINDYIRQYYSDQYKRTLRIKENDFRLATQIATWKKKMTRAWENIEVLEVNLFEKSTDMIDTGTEYEGEVALNLNGINPENVGVELVITENMRDLVQLQRFNLLSYNNQKAVYVTTLQNDRPGTFSYGIRVFPIYEELPHRQDFGLLKWI